MCTLAASPTRVAVGAPIEVYWPMDKLFYRGVVSRSLPNRLHVILYDDGMQETLDLRQERYRLLPSPARKPKSPKKTPSPSHPSVPHPSFSMDLVTYTPPLLPPRKRFRARLLRSKRSSNSVASQSPKVLLRQRIRPARLTERHVKKLPRLGDVMSDLSDYPNLSPKRVVRCKPAWRSAAT